MTDDRAAPARDGRFERPLLYAMSAFYALAGVTHFVAPEVYERIVPPVFPRPRALVYLSGVAEVLLGVGVLFRRTRRPSAWGIVALLIAVFPANVYAATRDVTPDGTPAWARGAVRAAAWIRLPVQVVLVRWTRRYTRPLAGSEA